MGKLDIDVAEVKKLIELVEAHSLEELTVEEGDLSITIKGRSAPAQAPVMIQQTGQAPLGEQMQAAEEEQFEEEPAVEAVDEIEGNVVDIVAPLVGVFYRAPSPDAANFVEIGDTIEVGSEVGLIEAMKVFSPLPSEVAGEVVAIPAGNGKLVQQGEVLVRIRVPE